MDYGIFAFGSQKGTIHFLQKKGHTYHTRTHEFVVKIKFHSYICFNNFMYVY